MGRATTGWERSRTIAGVKAAVVGFLLVLLGASCAAVGDPVAVILSETRAEGVGVTRAR